MSRPNKTGIKWRGNGVDEKEAMRKYSRIYRERNPEKRYKAHKASALKRKYGLSYEDFEEMLKRQEGKCALCGKVKLLQVDHNHSTGEVRGLLCQMCNVALGMLNEDKAVISKIPEYLK